MKFSSADKIPFPRKLVFEAHRDQMPEVVAYLDDIESVTVVSREEDGPVVHLVNRWKAAPNIPRALQKFLRPEMLEWEDVAAWNQDTWQCNWTLSIGVLPGLLKAQGRNIFSEIDGETEFKMEGEISINPTKVPGIPRLLARTLQSTIEGFIVAMIKPNLEKTNQSVHRYLEDRA